MPPPTQVPQYGYNSSYQNTQSNYNSPPPQNYQQYQPQQQIPINQYQQQNVQSYINVPQQQKVQQPPQMSPQ